MPRLSRRFQQLPPIHSPTCPRIKRDLKARGVDVIDLGVGDADLAPPPAAVEALRAAAGDPLNSRYSFQLGLPAFREEIAAFMRRRFGVVVDPFREILPLIGSKEGIFHLPFALLDPGDADIVPDPGYQAYLGGTLLAGGEPYIVPLRPEHDFLVPLDAIPAGGGGARADPLPELPQQPHRRASRRARTSRRRSRSAASTTLVLAYDNAYSEVAFDGYVPPSILEIEGAREVAVEFHSLSKTYNMTGWRVGWAVGNAELVGALSRGEDFRRHRRALSGAARRRWRRCGRTSPGCRGTTAGLPRAAGRGGAACSGRRASTWSPPARHHVPVGAAARGREIRGVRPPPAARAGGGGDAGAALGEGGEGFFRIALTVPEARIREAAEPHRSRAVGRS